MIDASVDLLDPAAGGYLDRALRPQTWELRLESFPCGEIILPFPPLIAITSVKYDDVAGTERTLTANTNYRTLGSGGTGKQSVAPPYNVVWPISRCYPESVRIRYSCGYDSTTDTMPVPIKQAIHLAVGPSIRWASAICTRA
jgi:hypothetical protein